MDSLFGKFLGFFTLPVFIGVIFAGFVSSKIKVPLFLQVLSPYTFLFFVLLSFTKNLFYSFQFMVSSIIFSTFFIFIISLKDYEQKKT
ncbi:hypothetical protein CSE_09480 [Caldisericum exile AZM16c01]|uniref:Uncharacterized protein n=1 Tax=Caldisericum exile (strain DSM 21853 / NBRC 104410 / AZM16c01) TaxID=511051 RepID=A0A7U6GET9_CALEA|nr:hypothetical protein CSE_09480 [Caldisericum exile AZM16c01]